MNEEEFESVLMAILDNFVDENQDDPDCDPIKGLITFESAGLLTADRGIVVRLCNGTEFQLTIKQSR